MPDTPSIVRLGRAFGDVLRGAFDSDGYDRYRQHHAAHHPTETPLERAAWFRRRQAERWHGISRCC